MSLPRFNQLDVIWDLPEDCQEWEHVQAVLSHLERHLADLGNLDQFLIMATSRVESITSQGEERLVVYQIRGEDHEIPAYANEAFMVFKNYGSFYPTPDTVRIVPVGCRKNTPILPVQQIKDREIDVFFVGRDDRRDDFFKAVDAYSTLVRRSTEIEVMRSNGASASYTPEVYAHKMAQAKLALCPRGTSHETSRIYEAMRSGCVVIAARQLPSWFSEGWPVVEIDDWADIKDVADGLLTDQTRLQVLSNQTRQWWEEKCSEEAVAHYMARELSLSLMKHSL
jgi:hypothetical protein